MSAFSRVSTPISLLRPWSATALKVPLLVAGGRDRHRHFARGHAQRKGAVGVGPCRTATGRHCRPDNRAARLPIFHDPRNPSGAVVAAAAAAPPTSAATAGHCHHQSRQGEHSQEGPRPSIPSHRLSPSSYTVTAEIARDRQSPAAVVERAPALAWIIALSRSCPQWGQAMKPDAASLSDPIPSPGYSVFGVR